MKKIKYLLLLVTLTLLTTGCVKFNVNMDIKKDKSMDFSVIYAFDSSMAGEQEVLSNDEIKELEKQGFKVSNYSDGKMKGFQLSKKIDNIDEVSTEKDTEYSLSGLLKEDENSKYLFKVEKGKLSNTYTAKFKFDMNDSNMSSDTDMDLDLDVDTASDETLPDETDDMVTTGDDTTMEGTTDLSDLDLSAMGNMELKYKVTLPYAAKSSNATEKNNDNKELVWDLTKLGNNGSIEFQFCLYNYNMTLVYGIIALIVILIVAVVIILIKGKKNNKKEVPSME